MPQVLGCEATKEIHTVVNMEISYGQVAAGQIYHYVGTKLVGPIDYYIHTYTHNT